MTSARRFCVRIFCHDSSTTLPLQSFKASSFSFNVQRQRRSTSRTSCVSNLGTHSPSFFEVSITTASQIYVLQSREAGKGALLSISVAGNRAIQVRRTVLPLPYFEVGGDRARSKKCYLAP
ncbi:hypothetical protein PTI98_002254 [Pleurotus ostreatus]|nr:hypothetical protein PTI98_002254 [Pleurotus ostreatus]